MTEPELPPYIDIDPLQIGDAFETLVREFNRLLEYIAARDGLVYDQWEGWIKKEKSE